MAELDPDARSRKLFYAAVAVLLLGLAVYAGSSRRESGLVAAARPAITDADPSLLRWPARDKGARRTPMSFDEFLAVFQGVDAQPAARRFMDAFLEVPRLRDAWLRAEKTKDLERFAAELKEGPEFHRLLAQHGADPEFKSLVETTLSRSPALDDLLAGIRDGAAAGPELLVRSPREFSASAGPLVKASGRDASKPGEQFVGAPRSGGTDAPGGRSGDFSGTTPDGPGDAAHQVKPGLIAAADAKSDPMRRLLEMYPWLGELSDQERRSLQSQIDKDGLWGACFKLKLYERCRSACAASGGQCRPVPGWNSCLDAYNGDENACNVECPLQPGCVPGGGSGGGSTSGGPEEPCRPTANALRCRDGYTPRWNYRACQWRCVADAPTMDCMITPVFPLPRCADGTQARWLSAECRYSCVLAAP
ncbi:MAG: hypothetical protein HY925_04330 [Elusimicrobia bacterium]|nr:hypothetical protein [Elusimicrobiota bacterium]